MLFKFIKKFSKGILIGVSIPIILGMSVIMFVFSEYDAALSAPKDCAVVFGAAVWKDNQPSHALYDRTKTGIDLYKKGFVDCLIFSGGPSTYGEHEAVVMQQIAAEENVPLEDVFLDKLGLSTLETFKNLPEGKSFVFVSNDFHLARIKMFAWKFGLEDFETHASKYHYGRYTKESYFVLRELAGITLYGLFWWKH